MVQTPKEKAEDIYQMMAFAIKGVYPNIDYEGAKECAIIAVEEIINTLNFDIRDLDVRGNILLDLIKYWRQVKDELEITKTKIKNNGTIN